MVVSHVKVDLMIGRAVKQSILLTSLAAAGGTILNGTRTDVDHSH